MLKKQNQLHPKPKKEKQVDKLGNDKNKLWFKSGNSTMLFVKDATKAELKILTICINNFFKQHNLKLEGTWLVTK